MEPGTGSLPTFSSQGVRRLKPIEFSQETYRPFQELAVQSNRSLSGLHVDAVSSRRTSTKRRESGSPRIINLHLPLRPRPQRFSPTSYNRWYPSLLRSTILKCPGLLLFAFCFNGGQWHLPSDHEIWTSPITDKRFPVDSVIKSRHTANAVLRQAGLPKAL